MGVRVEIAVDAWDGPRGALLDQVIPVRVSIANDSPAPLRIAPATFRLVSTTSHRTLAAVPPERLIASQDEPTAMTANVRMRSLPEGELQRGANTLGVVFFERPADRELGVRLQVPLVNAETGDRMGVLEMPLAITTDAIAPQPRGTTFAPFAERTAHLAPSLRLVPSQGSQQ